MSRKITIVLLTFTIAAMPAAASASVKDRWQTRTEIRKNLYHDAKAKRHYWDVKHKKARRSGPALRWKTRNMEAGRRRLVRHRAYQVSYAVRVVNRHTVRPAVGQQAYGGWAIPTYIVMCESGGKNLPPNEAGASGYYQIIPSTWSAAGGLKYAKEAYLAAKWEQDIVARTIWNNQAKYGGWVCA